ncbi:MAG: 16S rRNA (uracil(1498)-N(3))-methyltransferase [Leptospira sp.]|nr:16S rRNA (uracil(1498)-N(3))-methyltransferase [Leptospira sp.]
MEDNRKEFLIFRRGFMPSNHDFLEALDINHLKSLRLFNQDKSIEIRNGEGDSWMFNSLPNSKSLDLIPQSYRRFAPPPPIRLGGAIPKGGRLDYLLQKCTEIGVTEFHFTNFERSIRSDFSLDRSERIICEAASQSKRTHLPQIFYYKKCEDLIQKFSIKDFLFLDTVETKPLSIKESTEKILLIGPEGGFGNDREKFIKLGILSRNLGEGILRMETAYVYLASIQRQFHLESI